MAGEFKLDIKDTEFLLRYLLQMQVMGADVQQASITIHKLKNIQTVLMDLSIPEE
tara:strand:+ start:576 stop:740 length:165 start_codon:yes stop_codon:yes gene_type:complete